MSWIKVAEVGEVKPGAGHTVWVCGRELALFLVDGQMYCIDNSCPHNQGPLAEGDLRGEIVYCPWHYWPINVRTGELADEPGVCVAKYACKVEDSAVFIDFP